MKISTKQKLVFLFILFAMIIFVGETSAQPSTANYIFTPATNGSLTDMSSGTTEAIGPNSSVANSNVNSTVQSIGFNFIFMGRSFSSFGVSSRGTLRLGAASSGGIQTNNLNTATTNFLPLISPFWEAMGTSSTGKVHYKVTGDAPNRILTVEWLNMRIATTTSGGSTTADGTFQLRLYETTSKVEFVYGSMNIGTSSPVVSASIGFTIGNADNSKLGLSNIITPAVSTTGTLDNTLVNSNTPGPIAGLNSANQGERVIYTFTPSTIAPNAPTNLTFTNILDNSMTLNWNDNATDEAGYLVENVTSGTFYPFLAANSTSSNITGLLPGVTYTFRVYAVTEGAVSSPLQATAPATKSTTDYVFTNVNDGWLTDMSTGTAQLIGANSETGPTGSISSLTNIGFTFNYMGTNYTQFGANSRGLIKLGVNFNSEITSTNNLNSSSFQNIIAPFWDNIKTSSNGKVHYKIIGAAPSRVLVIEWLNMNINYVTTTNDGTFQLRLYETSNKIEFAYGSMNVGAGSEVVTASIGFRTTGNNLNNAVLSVTNIVTPAVTSLSASVNNSLVNSSTAGPISGLNSSSQGSRVVYTFTPPCSGCLPVPDAPTNLTFSGVGPAGMVLNWQAGNNASYYKIHKSTDGGTTFTFDGYSLSTSHNAVNLTPNTNYVWRVFSQNMTGKSAALQGNQLTASDYTYISGVKTVGATGDYLTISNAVNVIGLSGAAVLELKSDYNPMNESYPLFLKNIPGNSASNTLTIRPAAGVTNISLATDLSQTILIDGSDNVIIDGRPGGTEGTSSEINISNTNFYGNAILFTNGASNNTIKFCDISGANGVVQAITGVVHISGSGGNDSNNIDNCEIHDGAVAPAALIYVGGSVSSINYNISVTNCRLYNYNYTGVHFATNGSGHKVIGNSIYRTPLFVGTFSTNAIFFISTTGNKRCLIKDNFIGGSDVNCGGTPFSSTFSFTGMNFFGDSSMIQNNTIQNISGVDGLLQGISLNGINNVCSENTIGHSSIPNSIVLTANSSITGISTNSDLSICSDNIVANLTLTGTGIFSYITGIVVRGTDHNSIIEKNTIHNLTSSSTATDISFQSALVGIAMSGSFNGKVCKNTIYNLVNVPGEAGTANTSVMGIFTPGGTLGSEIQITSNRIYGLNNASSGTSPNIFGIMATGRNGVIANNQVSLDNGGNPTSMNIRGINVNVTGSENIWNVYYNSVDVYGDDFGALSSAAFYKQNSNTVNLRNNLFYNNRIGGTGGHYAAAFENNTGVTSDYNLLVAPSNVALWGATPYSFANYKTNSGLDGFSYSTDPATLTAANLFVDAATGNLNINASNNAGYYVDSKGIPVASINYDYSDSTAVRNTLISQGTTDIGSDEFEYTGTIPDVTASGPPALNTTTTYSFAGRPLGSITWGSTGSVPTGLTIKYNSGINPPGTLTGEYSMAFWDITPTGGSGYTYDITLNYSPAVLFNITNENNIKIAKRDSEWDYIANATVNTTNKTATATGLNSFSQFALTSSDAPLPVELASFTSMTVRNEVILDWSTLSEINNASFEIERSQVNSVNTDNFVRVGSIQGNGTTNEIKKYKFNDRNLVTGRYKYRLKQIDFNGNFQYFDLSNEVNVGVPDKYDLSQNYPNPFNPVTKINYDLPKDGKVNLRIYDITGREVAALINNEVQPAGYYTLTFNAGNLSSGVYFYRLVAGDFVSTKKLVLLK